MSESIAVMEEDAVAPAGRATEAAALQRFLIKLWSEVLSLETVDVNDNFFALGGRSLHVIMMINRLQEALGSEIQPTIIFEAQTINEFVAALTSREEEFEL
jgi:acyl carrier protein